MQVVRPRSARRISRAPRQRARRERRTRSWSSTRRCCAIRRRSPRTQGHGTLIYNAPPPPSPEALAALPRTATRAARRRARHRNRREVAAERGVARRGLRLFRSSTPARCSTHSPREFGQAPRSRRVERIARVPRGATEFEADLREPGRPTATGPCVRPEPRVGLRDAAGRRLHPLGGQHGRGTTSPRRAPAPCPSSTRDVHSLRGVRPRLPDYCLVWGDGDEGDKFERAPDGHRLSLLQGLPALRRVLSDRRAHEGSARRRASPRRCACRCSRSDCLRLTPWTRDHAVAPRSTPRPPSRAARQRAAEARIPQRQRSGGAGGARHRLSRDGLFPDHALDRRSPRLLDEDAGRRASTRS